MLLTLLRSIYYLYVLRLSITVGSLKRIYEKYSLNAMKDNVVLIEKLGLLLCRYHVPTMEVLQSDGN